MSIALKLNRTTSGVFPPKKHKRFHGGPRAFLWEGRRRSAKCFQLRTQVSGTNGIFTDIVSTFFLRG